MTRPDWNKPIEVRYGLEEWRLSRYLGTLKQRGYVQDAVAVPYRDSECVVLFASHTNKSLQGYEVRNVFVER